MPMLRKLSGVTVDCRCAKSRIVINHQMYALCADSIDRLKSVPGNDRIPDVIGGISDHRVLMRLSASPRNI